MSNSDDMAAASLVISFCALVLAFAVLGAGACGMSNRRSDIREIEDRLCKAERTVEAYTDCIEELR